MSKLIGKSMTNNIANALEKNFLGSAPKWYKLTILAFLIINPIIFYYGSAFVAGWILIAQFIFTLAMALKCYPLPAGGLIALEAVAIGMVSPETLYDETVHNFPVILLLMFMVAGIHFMKDLLEYSFTKILVKIKSKIALSLLFCLVSAFLSAFLDALTVTAVIISVAYGFYGVYHKYASSEACHVKVDLHIKDEHQADLEEFRGFLRNLMMHGAIGTALGGVCTLVGEPQNLLIAKAVGWNFMDFFYNVAPVSMPVLASGIITCVLVEQFHLFGYGAKLPTSVRKVLEDEAKAKDAKRDIKSYTSLGMQAAIAIFLILALAFHVAEVGLIGLAIIVLLTAFNGVIDEHKIGPSFEEALPFTALLVVFFAVVGVIHEQHLFNPVISYVLGFEGDLRNLAYYLASGALSILSDNVFVATVYINETKTALTNGVINADEFAKLAVSINTGTNIPSIATPNGQAAFLFLLTSSLAPVIRLSYGQMVKLSLPYAIVITTVGAYASWHWL